MSDPLGSIQADRGMIKGIQLVLPGYRGYRIKEDIRDADALVRTELADTLRARVLVPLEAVRTECAVTSDLERLARLGALIRTVEALRSRIAHLELGYSGISAPVRVDENALRQVYGFDRRLAGCIDRAGAITARIGMGGAVVEGDDVRPDPYAELRTCCIEMNDYLDRRRTVMLTGGL